MASILLSKSKYLNGLQCLKYLWILFNEPEKVPAIDAATQYIFDQGHLVGELAKKLFRDGIDIQDEDFIANIRRTREVLRLGKPLFEAGIRAGSIYARADILNPADQNEWDILEVKSTTSVKDVHIDDVAFQKFCYEKSGLKIRKCFLMYINNKYVRNGDIDPEQLLSVEDISAQVDEASSGIQERMDVMLDVVTRTQCPDITIGKHCSSPYGCPLQELCWGFLPENSVFNLHRGGKNSVELFQNGVLAIRDIPADYNLTGKQQIQRKCEMDGEPYIDREEIRNFLTTLEHPLYYLDFETFSPAVPMFDGTKPYQKIPFQFSLHVVEHGEVKPKHYSFLAEGMDDPRPKLLSQLYGVLGDRGTIIVYNQAFEKKVLEELGDAFPEYKDWIEDTSARIADLLSPFQSFYYYNSAQKGSASIKKVLPAITGEGYEGMDISDGEDASIAFQAITYGDVSEEVGSKVREDLEKYCGLDTEGMIWIIDKLKELLV